MTDLSPRDSDRAPRPTSDAAFLEEDVAYDDRTTLTDLEPFALESEVSS